jgi:hypothetical protein
MLRVIEPPPLQPDADPRSVHKRELLDRARTAAAWSSDAITPIFRYTTLHIAPRRRRPRLSTLMTMCSAARASRARGNWVRPSDRPSASSP